MTRKLAIVERLPGHTEVMGGFAALALELGYEPHLLFNHTDQFHVAEYLRTRIPVAADHIQDWSYINDHSADYNVILLNTSCVWLDYGRQLQHWKAHNRLIVVHHDLDDIALNPHGASLYLTPAAGEDKWIFPLYSDPAAVELSPAESGTGNESDLFTRDAPELPTLISIGSFDRKDKASAIAYMKAGGKLVHYDRHPCRHFAGHEAYTQHKGLDGSQLMTSLAQQTQPIFLWFPIVPDSEYFIFRFTGALIIGAEMNSIMVMPERLRSLYGFPDDAVITYDASLTETPCLEKLRASPAQQLERRKQLRLWTIERWKKNLAVLRPLLERNA
jgi:hypothetical protein